MFCDFGSRELTYLVCLEQDRFKINLTAGGFLNSTQTEVHAELKKVTTERTVANPQPEKKSKMPFSNKQKSAAPIVIKSQEWRFDKRLLEVSDTVATYLNKISASLNAGDCDELLKFILKDEVMSDDQIIQVLSSRQNLTLTVSEQLTGSANNIFKFSFTNRADSTPLTYSRMILKNAFNANDNFARPCETHPSKNEHLWFNDNKLYPICRQHPFYKKVCDKSLADFNGNIIEFFIKYSPEKIRVIEHLFCLLPQKVKASALIYLIKQNDDCSELFCALIKHDVNINRNIEEIGQNLFLYAITMKKPEYALAVLKSETLKTDLTACDISGNNAFHLTIKNYSTAAGVYDELLQSLLDKTGDISLLLKRNLHDRAPVTLCPGCTHIIPLLKMLEKISEALSTAGTPSGQKVSATGAAKPGYCLTDENTFDLFYFAYKLIPVCNNAQINKIYQYPVMKNVPLTFSVFRQNAPAPSAEPKHVFLQSGKEKIAMAAFPRTESQLLSITGQLAQNCSWQTYFSFYQLIFKEHIPLTDDFMRYLSTADEVGQLQTKQNETLAFDAALNQHAQDWETFLQAHPKAQQGFTEQARAVSAQSSVNPKHPENQFIATLPGKTFSSDGFELVESDGD